MSTGTTAVATTSQEMWGNLETVQGVMNRLYELRVAPGTRLRLVFRRDRIEATTELGVLIYRGELGMAGSEEIATARYLVLLSIIQDRTWGGDENHIFEVEATGRFSDLNFAQELCGALESIETS